MITKTTKKLLAAMRVTFFVCFVIFAVSVRSASGATCESIAALSAPECEDHGRAAGRAGYVYSAWSHRARGAGLREAAVVLPRDGNAHAVN